MLGEEASPDSGTAAGGGDAVLADLNAGLATMDEHLAALRAQRDRITALISAVERGGHLLPLPARGLRFFRPMGPPPPHETPPRADPHERGLRGPGLLPRGLPARA